MLSAQRITMSQQELLKVLKAARKKRMQAHLEFTDFMGLDVYLFNVNGATLKHCTFVPAPNKITYLPNSTFKDADLTGTDLSGASLLHATFKRATLNHIKMKKALLFQAKFMHAEMNHADLSDADLRQANFSFAQMQEAVLTNVNLFNANFENAQCRQASFNRSHLACANFHNADLSNALLIQANLKNVNLSKTKLDGAHFFPEQVALLDETVLYGMLNYYEAIYINYRALSVDPNLGVLRQHMCADLIRKINLVKNEYGIDEALRLLDIAIHHPTFAVHRKNVKVDEKNYTKSQMRLNQVKILLEAEKNNLPVRMVRREQNYTSQYLRRLSALNARQLGQLMESQQKQGIDVEIRARSDSEYQAYALHALHARPADLIKEALLDVIQLYKKEIDIYKQNPTFLRSLVVRYLSLKDDKTELLALLKAPKAFCNLSDTDFSNCNLGAADLRHANLSGAVFVNADLSKTRLDDANMSRAEFFPRGEQFNLENVRSLLNNYRSFYPTKSANMAKLRPLMLQDLIGKIHSADTVLSVDDKLALLNMAHSHSFFAGHRNTGTSALNMFCSLFVSASSAILTDSQKLISTEINEFEAIPEVIGYNN